MADRTVLLIPSDDFSWSGLRWAVREMPAVRVIGEVTDVRRAVEVATRFLPDVILMTDTLKEVSTIPLVRELRNCCPASKVAIFANDTPTPDALDAMAELHVTACVRWRDLPPAAFEHFLALVLDARLRLTSDAVAEAFFTAHPRRDDFAAPPLPLSPRQREVLNLIAQGMTNQEIGRRLGISPNTVGSHVQRIKENLGA